ncbi:Peptidoglycan/xylan/chitin deacetylase, PgdA/CDA1 family [Bacillus sp. OV322]|uniref:polysaccharide deacetylase family protein n=1 Tax=Bacillus sp. OV322 TaxID=1882764 RepID=UPI0008E6693E|nr:polysaccharide deacetylase family protein [Bacillus sp. OV322]SFC77673.1 Peptidoglycan/xylan/chitin deacetylase, PgdA/CDA1 family [Bacillus sp. OV322]
MKIVLCFMMLFICMLGAGPDSIATEKMAEGFQGGKGEKQQWKTVPEELTPLELADRASRKVAYLTFDDGPSTHTLDILDILDRYHIKGTFFVMGNEEKYADQGYKEMIRRGHTVALHSYTHDYSVIYRDKERFFQDVNRLEQMLQKKYGITSKYIRFPGGSKNRLISQNVKKEMMDGILQELKDKGYVYCDWNVDSTDGISPAISTGTIINSVLKGARNQKKAIILLHDINSMKNTVTALPAIIEGLKRQGYEFDMIQENAPIVHFR